MALNQPKAFALGTARERDHAVWIKERIEGQLQSLATIGATIGGATTMKPYTAMHYDAVSGHWKPWVNGDSSLDGVVLPREGEEETIDIHATDEKLVMIGVEGRFHYDHIHPIITAERAALDTALKTQSRLIVDDIVGRKG